LGLALLLTTPAAGRKIGPNLRTFGNRSPGNLRADEVSRPVSTGGSRMYRVARFSLVVLAVAGIVYAADSPFAGTWKLNLARSEFAGTTMTFEQAGAGAMKLTAEGQAYTFTMDGKDSLTPFSYSAAWTQVDAVTWQTVYKLPGAGAVMSTDTTKLSADGKALTVTSRGTMPNGERFENVAVYQPPRYSRARPTGWRSRRMRATGWPGRSWLMKPP
jgi:hypothetical protein